MGASKKIHVQLFKDKILLEFVEENKSIISCFFFRLDERNFISQLTVFLGIHY